MGFKFDDGWLVQDDYVLKAFDAGYSATMWEGKYLLFNVHTPMQEYVFDTLEELNRMMKLLVEE